MRGAGRVVFASTLLFIVGVLNVIYGIGALDGANVIVDDKRYVFENANTLGWVLIILGVIQFAGALSLLRGNVFGRFIAIFGAGLGAVGALVSIGGANPWWSFGIFLLCIYVIHGIFIYGDDTTTT
jgi:hypothetical protein